MRVKDTAKIIRHYANSFKVGNIIICFCENNQDFKFDFNQYYSEIYQAELSVRVITSPFYAKEFFKTFQKSVAQYEKTYGSNNRE